MCTELRMHPSDNIPDNWNGNIRNVFANMEAVRKARAKAKAGRSSNEAETALVPFQGGEALPSVGRPSEACPGQADTASGEQPDRLRIKLAGCQRIKMIIKPKHVDQLVHECRETFNIDEETPIQLHFQDGEENTWEILVFHFEQFAVVACV